MPNGLQKALSHPVSRSGGRHSAHGKQSPAQRAAEEFTISQPSEKDEVREENKALETTSPPQSHRRRPFSAACFFALAPEPIFCYTLPIREEDTPCMRSEQNPSSPPGTASTSTGAAPTGASTATPAASATRWTTPSRTWR